jgi:hypothetical protein
MKTKTFFTIAGILAFVMSCASQAGVEVYDVSVPTEKLCTIEIASTLVVTQFDGKEVKWAAPGLSAWKRIQISEGSHEFVMDYARSVGTGMNMTGYSANNLKADYHNFGAGHTYRIYAAQGSEIALGSMIYNKNVESGRMVVLAGNISSFNDSEIVVFLEDVTR